jgi:hypothetical protein
LSYKAVAILSAIQRKPDFLTELTEFAEWGRLMLKKTSSFMDDVSFVCDTD